MAKPKPVFFPSIRAIIAEHAELTGKIDALVKKQGAQAPGTAAETGELKPILMDLYRSICHLDTTVVETTAKSTVLRGWISALTPIDRLSALEPHGNFLAARMLLYFMQGFLSTKIVLREFYESEHKLVAERAALLLRLDDTLLGYLKGVWKRSRTREEFKWVFSDHAIVTQWWAEHRANEVYKLVDATSPDELFALGGGIGRRIWRRKEGDFKQYTFPGGYIREMLDRGPNGEALAAEDQLAKVVEMGFDGPIRGQYDYGIIRPKGRRTPGAGRSIYGRISESGDLRVVYSERNVLTRSRQFALDARKIAAVHLRDDRLRLAQWIMERTHPLPAELRHMVYDYMAEDIARNPYVEKLNLADAYSPFPQFMKDGNGKCDSCRRKPTQGVEHIRWRSCPRQSIVVWNLPLRAFMTFHLADEHNAEANNTYVPCKYLDCHQTGGHHEDDEWEMSREIESELEIFMTAVIRKSQGPKATLASVGFAMVDQAIWDEVMTDQTRQVQLFGRYSRLEDEQVEARWKGLSGLLDVMVHGTVLLSFVGSWAVHVVGELQRIHPPRPTANCMYGLKTTDEVAAQFAFPRRGNVFRRHCRFC